MFQLGEDELRDAIVLIYANKQDLPNAMSVSEVQQALALQEYRGRKVHDLMFFTSLLSLLSVVYTKRMCHSGTGIARGTGLVISRTGKSR